MLVEVTIFPDGKRTHEVIERTQGENCQKVHMIDAGSVVDEERTGPDCDEVHEIQS